MEQVTLAQKRDPTQPYQTSGRHSILCQLVRRGYKANKHHAVYQQTLLREGQFSPMLVSGLQKLHSFTAVTLESGWPSLYEHKERHTRSTLPRVWSPLYCSPFELDLGACVLYVGG